MRWGLNHLQPCKDGFVIRENITCNVANRHENDFLLLAWFKRVFRVPLNGDQSRMVETEFGARGIDRDCAQDRFYWISLAEEQIFSAKYDGSDQKPFTTEDVGWPRRLAVDWISRRLYWTDWLKNSIEVASLDNSGIRTVLISENVSRPWAIAVDPLQSKLYWLNNFDGKAKIEWSNLDGTERQVLVSSPQIGSISAMQVSIVTGELCYTDSGTGKIECMDPNINGIRTIASKLTRPWALAITDELFYWIERGRNAINSINHNGVLQKPITSDGFEFSYILAMTAVTNKCPLFYSPCANNNGDCPVNTICLVNPTAPAGRRCIVAQKCMDVNDCRQPILDN